MSRFLVVATLIAAFAACKKDNKSEGLPPAKEWSASTGALPPAPGAANPHAGPNPHAQANPHGDPSMPPGHPPVGQPGMPPGHPPVAGGAHGGNVAAMGLPPPDPNRPINPNNRVKGVIKVHAKAKDRVAEGGVLFVTVKRAGPDGAPLPGPPLAVDKLTWSKNEVPFELTEKNAMIAGTELTGDVVVAAWFDQDGEARSKQPGDVAGSVRVKIPADKVSVTLDEVLK